MTGSPNDNPLTPDGDEARDELLDRLFAEYVDRLNAGERIELSAILNDHPDVGLELFDQLQQFQDSTSLNSTTDTPLGTLGDYTLRRQIGRGGMGVVYEAWENSMDRPVALKVLPAGIAADTRASSRFLREAHAAGKLSHPNVVPVYFMGVKEQTPFYAMEFVEGETLAQIIGKIKDAEPETETPFGAKDEVAYFHNMAKAFADVADGLQHAHSKGVTHRDIKPSNLILDGDGRLRILDFGLAHLEGHESLTLSGDVVGTPLYMSPEQARRKKIPIDHRTDVYSLGATMYEAICGRPPFRGKNHADTLSQIIECVPVEPRKENPRLPRDLETIVLKCLRKDARNRYGTSEALGQDLMRFVRGDPVEAHPYSKWETVARRIWRQRHKLQVGAMLAILFLLAGLQLFRMHSADEQRRVEKYEAGVLDAVLQLQLGGVSIDPEGGRPLRVDTGGIEYGFGEIESLLRKANLDPVNKAIRGLEEMELLIPERPDAYYHHARGLFYLGLEGEALEALDRALACDPRFVPAQALRGVLLLKRGAAGGLPEPAERSVTVPTSDWTEIWKTARDSMKAKKWDQAVAAYDRLIAIEEAGQSPYLGSGIESYLGRGLALLEVGNPLCIKDLAVVQYQTARALEIDLLLGKAYYLTLSKAAAADAFETAYRRASPQRRGEVALWVTTIYRSFWDYERCREWVERVDDDDDAIRARMKAIIFLNLGLPDEAREAAREAVELSRDDPGAYRVQAIVYARSGLPDYKTAAQSLDQALLRDDRDFLSYYWRGELLCDQGKFREAETPLQRARDLKPDFAATYGALGKCAMMRNDLDGAFDFFDQAESLDVKQPTLHNYHGICLHVLGRLDEAIEYYKRASALVPKCIDPHLNRGRALLAQGRREEAILAFREATGAYPRNPFPHQALAEIYGDEGEMEQAFSELRRAFEVSPTPGHKDLRLALCRKETAAFTGELDALIEAFRLVRERHAHHPDILNLKALAYLRHPGRRNIDRACECAALAAESMGRKRTPLVLAALAECHLLRKDAAHAVEIMEEATGLPGARQAHADLLEESRRAALPDLPSYGSIDRALKLAGGDVVQQSKILANFARAHQGDSASPLLSYLEARLLQLAGKSGPAAEKFAALLNGEAAGREPLLRLIECLRQDGRPGEAELALHKFIGKQPALDRGLLNLCLAISFVDRGRSPGEVLDTLEALPTLPAPEAGSESTVTYGADLRWLLGRLRNGEPILINCGGHDYKGQDGESWGADRFFLRGKVGNWRWDVQGTPDARLYGTWRYFQRGLLVPAAYRIPLPPGKYRVTLHFAEFFNQKEGLRRFSVRVESEVVPEVDTFSRVGYATADSRSLEVSIVDGILDIEFEGETTPLISAIEIRPLK